MRSILQQLLNGRRYAKRSTKPNIRRSGLGRYECKGCASTSSESSHKCYQCRCVGSGVCTANNRNSRLVYNRIGASTRLTTCQIECNIY